MRKWVLGILLCVVGCGGTPTPSTQTQPRSGGQGDEHVERGRAVFDRVCGICHPGGQSDVGPALIDKEFSVERMTKQIREGSGRMRPISTTRLPDEYLPDLMVYLASLGAVRK